MTPDTSCCIRTHSSLCKVEVLCQKPMWDRLVGWFVLLAVMLKCIWAVGTMEMRYVSIHYMRGADYVAYLKEEWAVCGDCHFYLARSFFGEPNVLHMRIIKEETICSTCFNKHTANLKTDHHEYTFLWKFTIAWLLKWLLIFFISLQILIKEVRIFQWQWVLHFWWDIASLSVASNIHFE